MTYIGVDPGANGCMCILEDANTHIFADFKSNGIQGYADLLSDIDISTIYLEEVHAMPGQGVSSMFSFGRRFGELEGMLQTLKLKYTLVRPSLWQKTIGVVPKSGKKGIYEVVSQLYPNAQLLGSKGGIQDGRCDALGIAHYGMITDLSKSIKG